MKNKTYERTKAKTDQIERHLTDLNQLLICPRLLRFSDLASFIGLNSGIHL